MRRFALLSLLLLSIACTTASPAPDNNEDVGLANYGGGAGQSPVGVIPEATLRPAGGTRDLLMSVDYPTRAGSHPLLVFFHAAGASHRDYIGLSSVWASHNYVVIKPNAATSIAEVLDNLDRLEQAYPELVGKIDRTKIGVAGHAAGALTALRAAADPRVTGVVAMAPEETGEARAAIAAARKPVLFLTGTRAPEDGGPGLGVSTGGDTWLIEIPGATGASFSGTLHAVPAPRDVRDPRADNPFLDPNRDPTDPYYDPSVSQTDRRRNPREGTAGLRLRGSFNRVKGLTLAFWDAYLRGRAEGREALQTASQRAAATTPAPR